MTKRREVRRRQGKTLETQLEQVRERPGIHIVSSCYKGAVHAAREIIDNAFDALMEDIYNTIKTIHITFDERTGVLEVKDNGLGLDYDFVLDAFGKLYSSGNYDKSTENAVLKFSGGENGVGAAVVNFLSHWFEVKNHDSKRLRTVRWEEGVLVSDTTSKTTESGCTVTYQISEKFFSDLHKLTTGVMLQSIIDKADASPGVTTYFTGIDKKGKKKVVVVRGHDTDGLMKKYYPNVKLYNSYEFDGDNFTTRVAFGYDPAYQDLIKSKESIQAWTNGIKNIQGGTHIEGLIDGLHQFVKTEMPKNYMTTKEAKELSVWREDVCVGLSGVIVCQSNEPKFVGQFKEAVSSIEIKDNMKRLTMNHLKSLPKSDIKLLMETIKLNIKTRIKASEAVRNIKVVKNNLLKDGAIPGYFPPSIKNKQLNYSELLICEGISAASALAEARVGGFQSIFGVRGKINNVYDLSDAQIVKIEVINNLQKVVRAKIGNSNDIKFNYIAIVVDADVDGRHIRTLLLLALFRMYPEYVLSGKVIIVEAPYLSFRQGKKDVYVKNRREYAEYVQKAFSKVNKLYSAGREINRKAIANLIDINYDYIKILERLSNTMVADIRLVEAIVDHFVKVGLHQKHKTWLKVVAPFDKYKQLQVENYDDGVHIYGMCDGEYQSIQVTSSLLDSKRVENIKMLIMETPFDNYSYSIESNKNGKMKGLSLLDVIEYINSHQMSKVEINKGLGSMDKKAIINTIMTPSNRIVKVVKVDDIDEAMQRLCLNHGKGALDGQRESWVDNLLADVKDMRDLE